ncbi:MULTISPECIES: 4Fe-4S binding protein [unclassified Lentimicrobium]|uniref:FMN-binding protein n=1 Tax=unclassified Lentimicrobium TaxID=2677434 RepID=UPI0015534AC1|nr:MULTISPECIES: 4Fe-4S binding protein [unclassified Lentimicrobium]NPD46674.1 4Fe-4S binding protein [Lentimicrobium sp. S6]NPD85499.1 4Fe-4S binding protein [Lentimicrobium sp. L6]
MRISKYQLSETIYLYTLVLILLAAIAYSGGRRHLFTKSNIEVVVTLESVQNIFPEANSFLKSNSNIIEVRSGEIEIGKALVSSDYVTDNIGYGGLVPILIGLDDKYNVKGISLLNSGETVDYLAYVTRGDFLQQWNNLSLREVKEQSVDGATGATMSSNAIIKGMKGTAAVFYNSPIDSWEKQPILSTIKDVLFLVVVLLSLAFAFGKAHKKLRPYYLVLVVIVVGIVLNKTLSIFLLYSWLLNGIPWVLNWQSVMLFVLAIGISFLGKRKYYCNYLCPMGALQELVNKVSPFKKKILPKSWKNLSIREAYLFFIAAILLFGFSPQLNHFEPFMMFSFRIASYGFFIAGGLIVILSLFFNKPYCTVCPTGCFMDTISYKKQALKNTEDGKK